MLQAQVGDIPAAAPSPLSAPFWEGCRRGKLLYQYFPESGRAQFPPAPVDRESLSARFEWRESCGRGEVYSWTTVYRGQTPAFAVPYVAAIVTMDESYWMIANIIGCEVKDVHIGMRVNVTFHEARPNLVLPYFRPDS